MIEGNRRVFVARRVTMNRYWLLVAPALVLMAGFYLYPLFELLKISFTEPEPGFGNYTLLFTSEPIQRIIWTTVRVCIETTIPTVVIGYFAAYAMLHAGRGQLSAMMMCVMVSFWVSVLVRSFAWLTMLSTRGVVNTTLMGAGLIDEPLSLAYNEIGVVIGMIHFMLPFAILPMYSNMLGIDTRYLDAARGLGASGYQRFRHVFLPLSKAGIIAASLLVFVFSLGFFVTPAILGGGRVVMLAEYISIQIQDLLRWGLAATLSSVLLISVFMLLGVVSRFVDLRKVLGAK